MNLQPLLRCFRLHLFLSPSQVAVYLRFVFYLSFLVSFVTFLFFWIIDSRAPACLITWPFSTRRWCYRGQQKEGHGLVIKPCISKGVMTRDRNSWWLGEHRVSSSDNGFLTLCCTCFDCSFITFMHFVDALIPSCLDHHNLYLQQ